MNSTTSLSLTILDRRSLVSGIAKPGLSFARKSDGNRGDQLQGMELAAHASAEGLVDHLVLLDAVLAGESCRANTGEVMVAIVDLAAGGDQVAEHLADHVLVPGFLEVGLDHGLGVGVGFLGAEAHLLGSP